MGAVFSVVFVRRVPVFRAAGFLVVAAASVAFFGISAPFGRRLLLGGSLRVAGRESSCGLLRYSLR